MRRPRLALTLALASQACEVLGRRRAINKKCDTRNSRIYVDTCQRRGQAETVRCGERSQHHMILSWYQVDLTSVENTLSLSKAFEIGMSVTAAAELRASIHIIILLAREATRVGQQAREPEWEKEVKFIGHKPTNQQTNKPRVCQYWQRALKAGMLEVIVGVEDRRARKDKGTGKSPKPAGGLIPDHLVGVCPSTELVLYDPHWQLVCETQESRPGGNVSTRESSNL
ncbi:hypothetical protein F5B20DRAFT_55992 [Whalleya microplaca]|nr:hypothetical protein F5B20DRAFT_55992 [Whalleya microplaca]